MRIVPRGCWFTVPLLALGCTFGPRPGEFGPRGLSARVVTRSVQIEGELLAATDSSLILYRPAGVAEVSYRVIGQASFKPSTTTIRGGHPPDASSLARLRSGSRFPQGMSSALLQRFLEANHLVGHLEVIQ